MSDSLRSLAVVLTAIVVLGLCNLLVLDRERLLADGTSILLELGPRDPRSLIQGDYMALAYEIPEPIQGDPNLPSDGRLVVRLDEQGVGTVQRLYREGEALQPGEHLLRYRRRGTRIRLGAEDFFFQEGQAPEYQGARYGELKVDAQGNALLIGLRDAERQPLGIRLQP